MSTRTKYLLGVFLALALLFGFLDPVWPDFFVSFKRLHIFLFNLLAGGTLILSHVQERSRIGKRVRLYFVLALLYAICAATEWYAPVLVISVPLYAVVESIRIERFSWLPTDFFRPGVPVADKFKQASIICLSCGILIASLVILNNEYLHLVELQKMTIEVFFLGYSFPVSLITMSVMFSFMEKSRTPVVAALKEISFWMVNLGVIIFFVFILFEIKGGEILMSGLLFLAVFMIFFLFLELAPAMQQKTFLVSGMAFLLCTAITGIMYILYYMFPSLAPGHKHMLMLHATISLYGWNLSGLFVIIRWGDFPIKLNSVMAITLHWIIVMLLVPIGKNLPLVALPAMLAFILLLMVVIRGRPS